jgi:ribosomal-protein-serine acetyltransferase
MKPGQPPSEVTIDGTLKLIKLRLESAPNIFSAIDENRENLRLWLPFVDQTRKKQDTEIFIKSILHTTCPKKDLIYEIWSSGEFAGLIALKEIDDWNKKTELGYWIIAQFEGKGLVTRSCKALIDLSFSELGLNRVQLKAAIGNARSCLVAERLGFRMEGIEREGEQYHRQRYDLIVYSILKREWVQD